MPEVEHEVRRNASGSHPPCTLRTLLAFVPVRFAQRRTTHPPQAVPQVCTANFQDALHPYSHHKGRLEARPNFRYRQRRQNAYCFAFCENSKQGKPKLKHLPMSKPCVKSRESGMASRQRRVWNCREAAYGIHRRWYGIRRRRHGINAQHCIRNRRYARFEHNACFAWRKSRLRLRFFARLGRAFSICKN